MLVQVCYKVLLYSCIYRQINSFSKYCVSFVSQAICQMTGALMWETQSLLVGVCAFMDEPEKSIVKKRLLIMTVVEVSREYSENTKEGKMPSPRRC